MKPPGRPPTRREAERLFWREIAKGLTSQDAAVAAGAAPAVGTRWLRHAGGIPQIDPAGSGRYLSFAEREKITLWRVQGATVRKMAKQLGRTPSTISRKLRRNTATPGGKLEYRTPATQ
ncbi:helix-turn-helix domain-containing protein [Streptomyces glaucus]|uniref:Transposase IS30-like HTH domain-containing protein n=1 Tax=Streptomyces glaucus TaxID=284029 RepID=A0ABP5WFG5_9ACTN